MKYLSATEALEMLDRRPEDYQSTKEIRDLVNRVDIRNAGRITMLYSGYLPLKEGGAISANLMVETMFSNGDNIRIIADTQAARLIVTTEFQKAAGQCFGITDPMELALELESMESDINKFFYDTKNSLWSDLTKRFVAESNGEIRSLYGTAPQSLT